MKKFIGILVLLLFLQGFYISVTACHIKNKPTMSKKPDESSIAVLPTMNTESNVANRMWVGTFQIVWNEIADNIVGAPIEFVGGTNKTAKDLNNREFDKMYLNENSYYSKFGIVRPELKKEIETGIKDKFNETSDILGLIDFTYNPNKTLVYAMLKKDFKFLEPFDKLRKGSFGKNENQIEYFGIKSESSSKLYKNVSVLFYNSPEDYAVKMHTKSDDEVILYRTDDDKKFNEYFNDIKQKSENYKGNKYFGHYDRLKVPNISLYQMTNFPDLEGKKIKNSDFSIDKTIETVDFKMDNEGVKLKSEAAVIMLTNSLGHTPQIRYFYFDDTFVLFLIEKDKPVPYFALRANNVELLNKTAKK